LFFGSWLPVVAMSLARRLHGMVVGWWVGLLAAVHPLLIALSAAVLTESTYLTLSLVATYCVVDMIELRSRRPAVVGGIAVGLAYLCRPEGLVLAALFAVAVVVVNRARWRKGTARAALFCGVVAVFALPYVGFLYRETGQIRFEAKTADATRFGLAESAGLNMGEIYFRVDRDLVEKGNSNTSDLWQLQTTHVSVGQRVRLIARQTAKNIPQLLRALAGSQLGQPVLGMLVALGLFSCSWTRARARSELPLLAAVGLTLLTFGTWPFFHDRFLFPLMPALILWSGLGLERLRTWTVETAENLGLQRRVLTAAVVSVMVSAVALLCAGAAVGVRSSDEVALAWSRLQQEKPVGQWLRDHTKSPRPRLMDTIPTVAYYAGAVLICLPWTDSETALRYIDHKHPNYVILRDGDEGRRPYYADWLRSVPEQLRLLAAFPTSTGQTRIYEWGEPAGAP
jgi:hypothetical protein